MNNFIILCILAISSIFASETIDIRGKNSGIQWNLPCSQFTDCFNCTLANCNWNMSAEGECEYDNKPMTNPTIEEFIPKAKECGDPLSICNTNY